MSDDLDNKIMSETACEDEQEYTSAAGEEEEIDAGKEEDAGDVDGQSGEFKQNTTRSRYYTNIPLFGQGENSLWREQLTKGMTFFVIILVGILFYFAMLRLTFLSGIVKTGISAVKPIIYGLVIAFLLNPLVCSVDRHFIPFLKKTFPNTGEERLQKISRSVGIFLSLVLLSAVIVALLNMLIPELYKSIRSMINTVPYQISSLSRQINQMNVDNSTIGTFLTSAFEEGADYLQNWMRTDLFTRVNGLMSSLTFGVISALKELLNFAIGLIVSVYVLFSKEKFSRQSKKTLYSFFKPARANMILHITRKSQEIFGGFFIGKIIDSAIIGVLCFVGLSIMNMPYTMLVSVIVGVTNIIPFFGPYIGAIPSALLILLNEPRMGLYFIIFILVLQQLDGNVIGPKILGDSTGLSAFWVVFSILLGGGMFGVLGMIFGVPTFAVIYYIIKLVINSRLEKKKLPVSTDSYDMYSYVDSRGIYIHASDNEDKPQTEKMSKWRRRGRN